MKPELLPPNFDTRLSDAITQFWATRGSSKVKQSRAGPEDAVVIGQNMNGSSTGARSGASLWTSDESVHSRTPQLVLPGYFRATKNWDVLVVHKRRLLAVFEFKSQVGSFGNNLNNRSEEVIGSAADLWVAHHHRAFSDGPRGDGLRVAEPTAYETPVSLLNPDLISDPRPPFLGWLMLLEDCAASRAPVSVREPHFKVFQEFRNASYAERYRILCERLVERQLYAAAALVLTSGGEREHVALSSATSPHNLFREFAGRMLAAG
ncbi:MAG: PaeR7I family type II restriction endonuclease [Lysobacterales bacterium]